MSPDRLEALRRQRALVAQHLAWLDSEIASTAPTGASVVTNLVTNPTPSAPATVSAPAAIAAAASGSSPSPATVATVTVAVPSGADPDALAAANARADEIIAQYSTVDRFDPKSARRGCILLASAVFLLGLAGAMFAYLLYYNE